MSLYFSNHVTVAKVHVALLKLRHSHVALSMLGVSGHKFVLALLGACWLQLD